MALWSRGSHLRPRSPVCLFQHVARCIVATAAAMAISALGCCCAALQSRQPPPAPLHLCISALRPFSLASALGPTRVLCALRLAPRASCLAVTPNCVTRLPSAKLQPPQPSPPVGIPIYHPKPPIALPGKLPAAALLSPSRPPACSNSAAVRNAPACNRNCNPTRAQPFIRLQPPYLTTLQAAHRFPSCYLAPRPSTLDCNPTLPLLSSTPKTGYEIRRHSAPEEHSRMGPL
jgi:hypothetical protein